MEEVLEIELKALALSPCLGVTFESEEIERIEAKHRQLKERDRELKRVCEPNLPLQHTNTYSDGRSTPRTETRRRRGREAPLHARSRVRLPETLRALP